MMKKRLTAWLLVLCMTLSLLPGTAFAASGGNDGTITVYYDLNDGGKSPYLMKMTTTPGQEPPIHPGAVRAGQPFAGWAGDRAGSKAAEFKDGATLYAQWQSGYEISLYYNEGKDTNPGDTAALPDPIKFTTDNNGKLKERDLGKVDAAIKAVEDRGAYTFMGWYVVEKKGEYEKDDLFTKKLTTDTVIPTNGLKLYGRWETVYAIKFNYNGSQQTNADIETTTGGVLSKMPLTPEYPDDGYDFEAWYIIDPSTDVNDRLPGSELITAGQLPNNPTYKDKRGVKIPHDELSKFSFTEIAKALKALHDKNLGDGTITLVANWQLPAGIVFHTNGGHFGSDDKNRSTVIKTDNDGVLKRLPDPEPTLTGYDFIGWYKKDAFTPTGTPPGKDAVVDKTKKEIEIEDKFSAPETVYAAWKKLVKVTINFGTGDIPSETLYVPNGGQLSSTDYKKYLEDLTVKGYTIGDLFTLTPGSSGTGTEKKTLEEIKTYEFKTDTEIKVNLISGYLVNFWIEDENGNQVKLPYPSTDPTKQGNWYTNTQGHLINNEKHMPEKPTNPLKTFIGWYTADGKPLPQSTFDNEPSYGPFEGEQNFYAHYGAPYTITLNVNGGTSTSSTIKTEKDGTILINNLPTLTDKPIIDGKEHVFGGWYLEATGTNPVTAATVFDGPATIYAKWVKPTEVYKIAYNVGSHGTLATATAIEQETTSANRFPPSFPAVTETDLTQYLFGGWYTQIDGKGTKIEPNSEIPSDIFIQDATPPGSKRTVHIYAYWIPRTGTRANAANPSTFSLVRPSAADVPAAQADAAVKITFDPRDGKFQNGDTTKEVITKNNIIETWPAAPVRDGYTFKHWYISTDHTKAEVVKNQSFNADTTLCAEWERIPITITFDRNDGTGTFKTVTADDDGKISTTDWNSIGTPTRNDGWVFTDWFDAPTGDKKISQAEIYITDTTVYAQWRKLPVVTFDPDNGEQPQKITVKEADNTLPSAPTAPNRLGYEFKGWYVAKNGQGNKLDLDPANLSNMTFDQDTTYYAYWEATEWTITWDVNTKDPADPNDSSKPAIPSNPASIDSSKTVGGKIPNLPQLTRRGYRFGGWKIKDTNDLVTTNTPIYADTKLVAVWESLTDPTPPTNPVVTFIVDLEPVPNDAAHFTLETNSSHQLEQLPVLEGLGKVSGWRLEDGTTSVTAVSYTHLTLPTIYSV